MIFEIIQVIVLILASAYFSGTEIAFVVANKLKVEVRARNKGIIYKNILFFIKNPQDFFSAILISNNIVNISLSSISAILLAKYFYFDELTIVILSSFVILFFGELLPKYFARETADSFLQYSVLPLKLIYLILFPVVKIFSSLSNIISRSGNQNEENINSLFDKEDLHTLINESYTSGNIHKQDTDYLKKAIDLSDRKVYEAMIPRTDITAVEIGDTIEEAKQIFIKSGFSKLLVYSESIDNILGFIHVYDLFKFPKNIKDILRDIPFVPSTKKMIELLNELLDKRISIAIVVDEFGGTAGLISLEDIIEEMIGEIRDEYDTDDLIAKQGSDNSFIFSGKVSIDKINSEFDIYIPEGDYETLSGFITSKLGEIPAKGINFEFENYKMSIVRADSKKIDLIKIFKLD
ncbi:MAG: HlyC/CorC family transporter [Ignavibacteriales bacterium CG_4_9_14_3_um_filter_34_10]|nr:MAG: HlyC/CorC family transporter [Ignavibacteriales bacterium CG_4_9_14_3_um_filter_34_10]